MDVTEVFEVLAISLGLGLLVGIQRERAGSRLGGIRTFPLVAVLGTVAGLLAIEMGSGGTWVIAAGLLGVVALSAVGNQIAMRQDSKREGGITTETALVLMYMLGAYATVGPRAVVLAVGVVVAVVLHAKGRMHEWAGKLGEKDMRAILLFAAITFVVLPVLPDRTFGPMDVLNPRQIWLMAVLVVGISLGGYVGYKLVGKGAGTVLAGLLGGLISSTATTVSYARRARESRDYEKPAVLVIMLASTVVYARMLTEIFVVAPGFLPVAARPIGVMMGVSITLSLVVWLSVRTDGGELPEPENPTELKPALLFAALYAVVLVAVAAGRRYLGDSGIYAVSSLSGLTDMDAITLSTSRLASEGGLDERTAWRAIIVAALSNQVFKLGVIGVLGGRRLFWKLAVLFGVKIVVGIGLLIWMV